MGSRQESKRARNVTKRASERASERGSEAKEGQRLTKCVREGEGERKREA